MRPTASFPSRFQRSALAAVTASLLALAGCANEGVSRQASSSHINPTLEDAQRQARGTASARAPSQLSLGFGEGVQQQRAEQEAQAQAASEPQRETTLRALAEPRTFLGTIPCQSANCAASRISLTMSPGGHWRARITPLGGSGQQQSTTAQGCWSVVSHEPPRIILLQEKDVVLANLGFINDNVMRVNQIHGTQPTLEYRLTRQAEIDPVDELKGKPLPACSPN